jgi:hypothetical protein
LSDQTTAELLTYMSQRLLQVAELNTVLDQFTEQRRAKIFPASGRSIRFVEQPGPYSTYVFGREDRDFGGFDFQDTPTPLQTRALTAQDRAELEALGLF